MNERRRTGIIAGALVALVIAGTGLRVNRLAALGLTIDEGYQAHAVEAVLDQGLPRLESGYVYSRSPLFVYLQALCAGSLELGAFAIRLPAVIFGVLCIPLAYLLGRDLIDCRAGLLVAALMALSVWEIELSRYGRFYTMLQACFIGGIFCFYRGFIQQQWVYRIAYLLVTALAIMTHQLGAMLGLCFLVLLPLNGYSLFRRVGFVAWFGAIGVMYVSWRYLEKIYAKSVYGSDYHPLQAAQVKKIRTSFNPDAHFQPSLLPQFKQPEAPFMELMKENQPALWYALLLVAGVGAATVIVLALRRRLWAVGLFGAGAIIAAAFQQTALVIGLSVLLLAFGVNQRRELFRSPIAIVYGLVASLLAVGLFWTAAQPRIGLFWAFWKTMEYPDLDRYVLHWFRLGWPIIGPLTGLGLLSLLLQGVRQPDGKCSGRWLLIAMVVLPIYLASMVGGTHNESRYFFHLYPLLLLVVANFVLSIGKLAARWSSRPGLNLWVVALLALALIALSPDLQPARALAVSTRHYGDPKDPIRSVLNWPHYYAKFHQDQVGPSHHVREHRRAGDRLMVVGPPHRTVVYAHYAGKVDYLFGNPEYYGRMMWGPSGQVQDPITGAEIIYDPDRLAKVLGSASIGQGLWILADDGLNLEDVTLLPPEVKRLLFDAVAQARRFTGQDHVTFAAYLPPNQP